MKANTQTYIIGAVALAIGFFLLSNRQEVKAQNKPRPQPSVVILRGYENYLEGHQNLPGGAGDWAVYRGIYVQNASWSSNAASFELPYVYYNCTNCHLPPHVELSQAIADYLADGYEVKSVSSDGLAVTLVR